MLKRKSISSGSLFWNKKIQKTSFFVGDVYNLGIRTKFFYSFKNLGLAECLNLQLCVCFAGSLTYLFVQSRRQSLCCLFYNKSILFYNSSMCSPFGTANIFALNIYNFIEDIMEELEGLTARHKEL